MKLSPTIFLLLAFLLAATEITTTYAAKLSEEENYTFQGHNPNSAMNTGMVTEPLRTFGKAVISTVQTNVVEPLKAKGENLRRQAHERSKTFVHPEDPQPFDYRLLFGIFTLMLAYLTLNKSCFRKH